MTRSRVIMAVAGGTLLHATDVNAADWVDQTLVERKILNTISLELSPEFAARSTATQSSGSLTDAAFKIGYSRSLGSGWSWGISDQNLLRATGKGRYQNLLETTVGYSISLSETLTVPLSAGVGYAWDQRAASAALGDHDWAYYVATAGLNVTLDERWTWNAVNARYRDAFDGGWKTPKVTTGVTYTIDPRNAVYANVGYAWKTGSGGAIAPDIGPEKWNVTLGYKVGF